MRENELEEQLKDLTKIYKDGKTIIPYCVKTYENCFKDQNCYYYREMEVKNETRKS